MSRLKGVRTPVVIDVTDKTILKYPGFTVLRDADGTVIALCPLTDDVLPNGYFSYAEEIQTALNSIGEQP